MKTIEQVMRKFGYTESETSIYKTLLEGGNLTGYEVSKRSGVPRSKVYNLLETLVSKGLVIVNKSEPKLYQGLSTEEFVESLKRQTENDIELIDKHFSDVKEHSKDDDLLWKVSGYESIFNKAKHMIDSAQDSLYIQIWEQELSKELIESLVSAEERLQHFVLILFKENEGFSIPIARYYDHGYKEEKLKEFGHRWLNVISDSEEVLFGELNFSINEVEVIWTKNNSMKRLAKEYIKHDAYTLKIIDEVTEPLMKTYGGDLNKIREIY